MSAPGSSATPPTGSGDAPSSDNTFDGAADPVAKRLVDLAIEIAAPASLVTALLVYFGWVRSNAIARHWGYSTRLIGLGEEDFLLRSISPMFRPVAVGVVVVLTASLLGGAWRSLVSSTPNPRMFLVPAMVGTGAFGAAFLAFGLGRVEQIEAELRRDVWWYTGSAFICAGFMLAASSWCYHAIKLLGARSSASGAPRRRTDLPPRVRPMGTTALVAGVALVGVFILTTQFAGRVGKDRAQDTERELPFRAEVSVLSERRLHLQAQGVQEYAIPPSRNQAATGDSEPADSEETDRYRWRYTGLRLLTQGNGQLILVPGDYTEDPKIFVVPLGDGVRLDIDSTANRLLLGASAPQ